MFVGASTEGSGAAATAGGPTFSDKLVQDVARHLDVVAGNAERRDDVLLGVAFLHEPGDVLEVDVFVGDVGVVVVGGAARGGCGAR